MTIRRFIIALTLLAVCLPQTAALAIDQRCFTKTECERVRSELGLNPAEAASGFMPAALDSSIAEACGGTADAAKDEIGFCLPLSQSKTTISFGGKSEFSDIGDFIRYIYRYGIWAAGIVAVIMIIVAGFQWTASGGSADTIGAAKKRIGGALTGLVLLALSYVVLNTINPYLVNLRLPQVWLINKQGLVPAICNNLEPSDKIEFVYNLQIKPEKLEELKQQKTKSGAYSLPAQAAQCSQMYLVKGAGQQMCRGSACVKDAGQVQSCYKGLNQQYEACHTGNVGGIIYNSLLQDYIGAEIGIFEILKEIATESWEWPWANEFDIYAVCKDGGYTKINSLANDPDDETNEKDHWQEYRISVTDTDLDKAASNCGSQGGLKGFVVGPDMNESFQLGVLPDEEHLIGIDRKKNVSVDLGDEANGDESCLLRNAPDEYFITLDELKSGLALKIDAGKILNEDNGDSDRLTAYEYLGYKACVN